MKLSKSEIYYEAITAENIREVLRYNDIPIHKEIKKLKDGTVISTDKYFMEHKIHRNLKLEITDCKDNKVAYFLEHAEGPGSFCFYTENFTEFLNFILECSNLKVIPNSWEKKTQIKVGQKWKHDVHNYIFEITNIFEFEGRIYYEYLFGGVHDIRPAKYLFEHFTLIPEFRPHWLLDNGTKIYAEEVATKETFGFLKYKLLLDLIKIPPCEIGCTVPRYEPKQYKYKECDFGVLFHDGSYRKATWVTEESRI